MKRLRFVLTSITAMLVASVRHTGAAIAQTATAGASLAQRIVATFDADFQGPHAGFRPNHAKGFICKASFTPAKEAAALSSAAHFRRPVEALVRFSNFGGLPDVADNSGGAAPYGMSVKFVLPDGSETDIVGHSTPYFPAPTAEEFNAFLQALGGGAAGIGPYIAAHPKAKQFVESLRPAPVSYATLSYHYINAFRFVAADGTSRAVRYAMEPQAGEAFAAPDAVNGLGPSYLRDELRKRLTRGPARFDYVAQLAEPGDVTSDPTAYWPASRRRVRLGTLTISAILPNSDERQRTTLFTPARLTPGIALSDDPMVAIRSQAYAITFARRNA